MNKAFRNVGRVKVGRSVFDLSYERKFSLIPQMAGKLIPIMCDEVVPGDIFKIGNRFVLRFLPTIAPLLHEVNIYTHYFFVPYRILWKDWENFITGGYDGKWGQDAQGNFTVAPPTLLDTINSAAQPDPGYVQALLRKKGSLFDFLYGIVNPDPNFSVPAADVPLAFPLMAYQCIWKNYYLDENLLSNWITFFDNYGYNVIEGGIQELGFRSRCWEKDYFTSALPFQQRGIAPALPISGQGSAVFPSNLPLTLQNDGSSLSGLGSASVFPNGVLFNNSNFDQQVPDPLVIKKADLDNNTVDFTNIATFNVADIRLAFQVQKWLERNARAGARYTEFIKSHFPAYPRDDRLDRPEYIGGSKSPIITSEVLQTSSTDPTTPQGNLAGHGISVDRHFIGRYKVPEFGLIMGIMSIMPRPSYMQGLNRQWSRRTRYDFYFPEFAHLSEQAILCKELYFAANAARNQELFGYQGRYDEMRYKPNMVHGSMRDTLSYWHLSRKFTDYPLLNNSFVECNPDFRRIFAVPGTTSDPVDTMIMSYANIIKAIRPMPVLAEPGLIDHY